MKAGAAIRFPLWVRTTECRERTYSIAEKTRHGVVTEHWTVHPELTWWECYTDHYSAY